MKEQRIDIVLWENVDNITQKKEDQEEAIFDTMKRTWKEINYDVQPHVVALTSLGLPHNRNRLVAMILNRHDPKTFDLSARPLQAIFQRFRRLYQLCERKHGCASDFLLDDKDPLVLKDLKYRQEVARSRKPVGYDQNKAITACKSVHVDWATLKPTPELEKSRWYKTLSPVEKDRLCAAIAQHPDDSVFFRDSRPGFGRGRASSCTDDGLVVSSCVMPQQTLFIFDKSKPKRDPRIVL